MKRILEVKKKIGVLSKNAKNPFFKSQYLDLNELLTHVEPLLWENNLLLLQPIQNGYVFSNIHDVETNDIVAQSFIELPDISDPQKLGSAITYFRRYTLKSLLSISEEDDDGNKASVSNKKPELKKKPLALPAEVADILMCDNIEKVRDFVKKFDLVPEDKQLIVEHGKKLKDESK